MSESGAAKSGTAKLFKHGRSQAVRLPKEFRMPGTEVRVRRIGRDRAVSYSLSSASLPSGQTNILLSADHPALPPMIWRKRVYRCFLKASR